MVGGTHALSLVVEMFPVSSTFFHSRHCLKFMT